MKVQLYHGTSVRSADAIVRHGFKDRTASGKSNWEQRIESKAGFVYLTTAYPFYFAMNAAKGGKASVIKVEVDTDDLYPDEDMFFFKYGNRFKVTERDLEKAKHLAGESLRLFGNVSAKPESLRILGRKDFNVREMVAFSDPSISPVNYRIMGDYYRRLVATWWEGGDLNDVEQLGGSTRRQFIEDTMAAAAKSGGKPVGEI